MYTVQYEQYVQCTVCTVVECTVCTIFHARDTDLTEMLDYFSAFATVLASLLVCCIRIGKPSEEERCKMSVNVHSRREYQT